MLPTVGVFDCFGIQNFRPRHDTRAVSSSVRLTHAQPHSCSAGGFCFAPSFSITSFRSPPGTPNTNEPLDRYVVHCSHHMLESPCLWSSSVAVLARAECQRTCHWHGRRHGLSHLIYTGPYIMCKFGLWNLLSHYDNKDTITTIIKLHCAKACNGATARFFVTIQTPGGSYWLVRPFPLQDSLWQYLHV